MDACLCYHLPKQIFGLKSHAKKKKTKKKTNLVQNSQRDTIQTNEEVRNWERLRIGEKN